MSSRQEEKERRRQERLEAEQKANAAARSRRRLQMVGGVLIGVVALVVVVVLATSGGGDDGPSASTGDGDTVAIPRPGENAAADRLDQAARAAGCEVTTTPSEGQDHTEDQNVRYKANPPTSGPHNPTPAQDGIYDAGNSPEPENWVHTLEHGRIIIQYKPGTPERTVSQLTTLFNEEVNGSSGYHTVLMENNTRMEPAIAAVAWTRSLGCPEMNPRVFDAIRSFRTRYVDKAPEFVP
jgi:hypothetical protein